MAFEAPATVSTFLQQTTQAAMRTVGLGLYVNNTTAADVLTINGGYAVTLTGNGAVTLQLPSTSATLARTDAGQTFTGASTCTSWNLTTPAITGYTITGTGTIGNGCTMTTPNIGAATASSINKVTFTTPATSAVLTIDDGITFRCSNSLRLIGTNSTEMTFPSTNQEIVGRTANQTLTNKTLTSPTITSGVITATTLTPATNDGCALGTTSLSFSDLCLASGAVIYFNANDVIITHTAGILTMGTGELRITTAGTNTASVVTVGGTQTLSNKTLTTPNIGAATGTSLTLSGNLECSDLVASVVTFDSVITAALRVSPTAYSSTGAVPISTTVSIAVITYGAGAGTYTVAAPSSINGQELTIISTTAQAHVVTFTGGTLWDGTAGVNSTVTFPAIAGASVTVIAYGTLWYLKANNACTIAP